MKTWWAALLLFLLAPSAAAQLAPQWNFSLDRLPDDPVDAGTTVRVTLVAERVCGNTPYLPEQTLTVPPPTADKPGFAITGPTQIVIGEQICPTEPRKNTSVEFLLSIGKEVPTQEVLVTWKF